MPAFVGLHDIYTNTTRPHGEDELEEEEFNLRFIMIR